MNFFFFFFFNRERSGSVVECLTRDRRAAGSSLTGVTALWSAPQLLARNKISRIMGNNLASKINFGPTLALAAACSKVVVLEFCVGPLSCIAVLMAGL